MVHKAERRTRTRRPSYELLLVIGLPVAVLLASMLTLMLAAEHGFTPIQGIERLVGTR